MASIASVIENGGQIEALVRKLFTDKEFNANDALLDLREIPVSSSSFVTLLVINREISEVPDDRMVYRAIKTLAALCLTAIKRHAEDGTTDVPMRRHFCKEENCEHVLTAKNYYFSIFTHCQSFVIKAYERKYAMFAVEKNLQELTALAFQSVHDILCSTTSAEESWDALMERSVKTVLCKECNAFLNEILRF